MPLAEAGDLAVVDFELVVPDNGDAVSGSRLVSNGPHELEALERSRRRSPRGTG